MAETSPADASELIDNVAWSMQYKEYFDQISRRAEMQEMELTPQEQQEREKIQERRLNDIFARDVKRVKLDVQGNIHTNTEFLEGEFDFSEVSTIKEAIQMAQQGVENIESLGVIEDAAIHVDTMEDPEELAVTISVKEINKRGRLETGMDAGSEVVKGNVGWKLSNVFGNAETLKASASMGTDMGLGLGWPQRSTHSFNLEFFKPRAFDSKSTIYCNLFKDSRDRSLYSSYLVDVNGSGVTYTSPDKNHSFTYGLEFRGLVPKSRSKEYMDKEMQEVYEGPSPSIIDEGNTPVVKSSLRYTFMKDERDNRAIPTKGHAISVSAEFAGLGGDVQFIKANGSASYHYPLNYGYTLNLGLCGGLIKPLGSFLGFMFSDNQTRVCDRITCGGQLISRGYQQGLGPRDNQDCLNADLSLSGGVSVTGEIKEKTLYWHCFLTASGGSLLSRCRGSNLLKNCMRDARYTVGASLVLPIGGARLEMGLAQPLVESTDPFSPLFWGFGIEFL